MLKVEIKKNAIQIGEQFILSLQRTLRIPNDGKTYPLPPGLGEFPVYKSSDFKHSLPNDWLFENSFIIPMYQREALWLAFKGTESKPNAVKVDIGRVNAVSGEIDSDFLNSSPQNYMVCPRQLWLDGINSGKGSIRQFVAMPLGLGYTVEACVSGKEEYGGILVKVFEAKQGVFPDYSHESMILKPTRSASMAGFTMGLAAGGQIKQKIFPDPHGFEVWDLNNFGEITIHIVNSEVFHQISGCKCPSTPVDAHSYIESGLPWFDLYEEGMSDVAPPEVLTKVKSLEACDLSVANDIQDTQLIKLRKKDD